MSSPWIQHVKNYQAQNGGSYRDAMQNARPSYNSNMTGGKFNLKNALRKTKNTVKKVSHEVNNNIDKYGQFVPQEYQNQLSQVQGYANQAQDLTGGKFNLNRAMRKTKNTVKQVKNVARIAAPVLSVVAPEFGIPLEAAVLATGGKIRKNPYLLGGSFKTHGGKLHNGCPQCGSYMNGGALGFGTSQSSILSSTHNSFAPLKPKPYKDRV